MRKELGSNLNALMSFSMGAPLTVGAVCTSSPACPLWVEGWATSEMCSRSKFLRLRVLEPEVLFSYCRLPGYQSITENEAGRRAWDPAKSSQGL